MPTSSRQIRPSLTDIFGKFAAFLGSMCTGKRQTHIRNAPSSRTAVTGIDPYKPLFGGVLNLFLQL